MQNLINTVVSNGDAEISFGVKDLRPAGDVRWCAGCGDYAVLSQVQKLLPELGVPRENIAFISGIGCSSRFPYYMNTYGFHTIHGRAAAVATGLKVGRPELSVWVISGDGDALSIGGNHTMHLLRRNVDVNFLLLNNQIYGLTKGQYSPTSQHGQITKSSPAGMPDYPFNPASLALGAGGSFVARTLDRDLKHLAAMLRRAAEHKGTSFLEVYQNCVVFNDGAFDELTDKATKPEKVLFLEHGKPLIFGTNGNKGIRLDGLQPQVVSLEQGEYSADDLLIYNEHDQTLAYIMANLTYNPDFPRPVGVLFSTDRPRYEEELVGQIEDSRKNAKSQNISLDALFTSGNVWTIS